MVDDQDPSTSVLVDVVYLLGGDVTAATAAAVVDPEVAERLFAAAALLGIARRIMHDIAEFAVANGLSTEQLTDVANDAGLISGDGGGTEWLRAG